MIENEDTMDELTLPVSDELHDVGVPCITRLDWFRGQALAGALVKCCVTDAVEIAERAALMMFHKTKGDDA